MQTSCSSRLPKLAHIGLARSKQDPINRGHGTQFSSCITTTNEGHVASAMEQAALDSCKIIVSESDPLQWLLRHHDAQEKHKNGARLSNRLW
jgi:hypothetical protein